MIWKFLADSIVVIHAVACAFVIFGPLLVWRSVPGRIAHLVITWGSTLMLIFYCPYTSLEVSLRYHYDPHAAYTGGFVRHYMNMIAGWEPDMTLVKGAEALWGLLWLVVYSLIPARRPGVPSSSPAKP